jgi:hypothetical protein
MFISLFRSKLKFYYEVFVFHLPSFPRFSARGASNSFLYRAADVNPLVAECRISRLAMELHGKTRKEEHILIWVDECLQSPWTCVSWVFYF